MNEQFKIGEIAIAQYFINFPEYNGCECEIIDSLQPRRIIDNDMTHRDNVMSYKVQFSDGMVLGAVPSQLRRKPLPKIDINVEIANEVS